MEEWRVRAETARQLSRLTGDFYARTSASFSATRSAPWEGWEHVLAAAADALGAPVGLRVLDLACGNLRFERFLAEAWQPGRVEAFAIDACDDLAAGDVPGVEVRYQHLDIVSELASGQGLASSLDASDCDLCACFGFMHHLPLPEQRLQVLRVLVACARPGGVVAVSFWQLSQSERLLRKAQETTTVAAQRFGLNDLGPGDYLLGWQERDDVLRYCHDFSEAEIDELAKVVSSEAEEIARFSADGASHNLNRYLLLKRRSC